MYKKNVNKLAQILKEDVAEIEILLYNQNVPNYSLAEAEKMFKIAPKCLDNASRYIWWQTALFQLQKINSFDVFADLYPHIPLELRGRAISRAISMVSTENQCNKLYQEAQYEWYCDIKIKIAILKKWIQISNTFSHLVAIQLIAQNEHYRQIEELCLKKQIKVAQLKEQVIGIYNHASKLANRFMEIKILALKRMLQFT